MTLGTEILDVRAEDGPACAEVVCAGCGVAAISLDGPKSAPAYCEVWASVRAARSRALARQVSVRTSAAAFMARWGRW